MKEFRKVHQFNCFTCNTPLQVAIAEYIANETAYLSLPKFYQAKRDFFAGLMKATPFKAMQSHGSYFQCYSYAHLSGESDKDFALRLIKEYGIVTIPVSAFYKDVKDDQVLRFCFAKKEETLEKAVEKLVHFK
jgi:methionine aminotransferase